MTEQELDRIIVYLIPQATKRQTEVLMGQLNVHKELLEMREDESKQHQTPRHPPSPPMSPFSDEGNEWSGG